MNSKVLQRAHELMVQGVPFALATVVRRERPTSGQPGDKAIITFAGEFVGWVGGSCAQPTVLQEAQKALTDGEPRLVVLTPNLDAEVREGVELYRMTCYSGGTMEIYIEPYLPEPQLLVCGASPAAEALVTIGKAVGFQVVLIDPSATAENFPAAEVILPRIEAGKFPDTHERYAVVATMGNWDEEAIKDVLALSPEYIGLVASKKRFQEVVSRLSGEGVSREQLALVTCPAGLDIAARTLPEVALSIMAEIVSRRRSRAEKGAVTSSPARVGSPAMAEDPVCHMSVDPRTARHRLDFEGLEYYFCNAACKTRFEKDPQKYLAKEVQV
jgi:xanthine dehydrogenase accessory factor